MHYLLIYELAADYLERRGAFRNDHLKLAWQSDALVLGGGGGAPPPPPQVFLEGD